MDKKKKNRAFSSFCSVLWTGQMETMWGAYAAQAAYFLIMSFIPFILFLRL